MPTGEECLNQEGTRTEIELSFRALLQAYEIDSEGTVTSLTCCYYFYVSAPLPHTFSAPYDGYNFRCTVSFLINSLLIP